jgi:hypothetical protein
LAEALQAGDVMATNEEIDYQRFALLSRADYRRLSASEARGHRNLGGDEQAYFARTGTDVPSANRTKRQDDPDQCSHDKGFLTMRNRASVAKRG